MLLAVKLQARQLQRAVEPQGLLQVTCLCELLFKVVMRQVRQCTVELFLLPFLLQLLAVIVALAGPGFKVGQVLAQPAFKLLPDLRHRHGGVDIGLGNARQLAAEGRQ